ncbi:MAG: carbamoyltransferase family protein [Gemmatimonadaceae bacterium]
MLILGISAFFHDSAACIVRDGVVVAAAQEERFSRKKHDPGFPTKAIQYCLAAAGATFDDVDHVGFYEKPHLKFERILANYAISFPKGFETFKRAVPNWFESKLWLPSLITDELVRLSPSAGKRIKWGGRLVFSEHHAAHAASAFYPSPFREAAILTVDGVGEWATTTLAEGTTDDRRIPRIEFLSELRYPDSLGMLYAAFTAYLGFKVNSGEYKVMGLAPYGTPRFAPLILEKLVELLPDGSFRLNMEYFSFPYDWVMVRDSFSSLFGLPPRSSETLLTETHFDIASSLQHVTNTIVYRMANHLQAQTGKRKLCMAGGVALNCVANGLLWSNGPFEDIWIQPAAGDAGGALGVALYIWHDVLRERRAGSAGDKDLMQGAYLGPSFQPIEIKSALNDRGIIYKELDYDEITDVAANLLRDQAVIGWFQGRMEFGPRALGARSILGDARSPRMQRTMNLKIKYRESFRPFAPSVLREHVSEWFDLEAKQGSQLGRPGEGYDSPYMLLVAQVRADKCAPMSAEEHELFGIDKLNVVRGAIPACTHVDYSARIQTVDAQTNPRFHALLSAFNEKCGVPLLVNTSFNVRGEPIVCTPNDAINCFLGTELDALIMENILVLKADIPKRMRLDYKARFSLD